MTYLRRRTLWAAMAVAMAAMLIPSVASAQASEWRTYGAPMSGAVELDGYYGWQSGGQGWECPVSAEATLLPEGKGEITSFDVDGCVTFGGLWAGCKITSHEFDELPMPIHLNEEANVAIDNFNIWINFSNCIIGSGYLSGEDVTATPDDPTPISSFELGGPATFYTAFGTLGNSVYGNLDLTPAGVIEIG